MGTTYSVKFIEENIDSSYIHSSIDSILNQIILEMSTYLDSSTISKFNALSIGDSIYVKSDFINVFNKSLFYYSSTNGSFEVTIKPLIDLWGFEGSSSITSIPDTSSIIKALNNIGIDKIKLNGNYLHKTANVTLDFSAIAKGYAVDKISELLKNNLISNYMVEIGGELSLAGYNLNKQKWSIGIQNPLSKNIKSTLNLTLTDKSVATSGNYRNFFIYEGKKYSHIISPVTGYPVDNNILSVTIISDHCMDADALATSLMVMSINDGMALIESIEDAEVFYITKEGKSLYSKGFRRFIR